MGSNELGDSCRFTARGRGWTSRLYDELQLRGASGTQMLSALRPMKYHQSLFLCLLAASAVVSALHGEQNWFRFGGPDGSGLSAENSLPVKWNAESVVWKTTLKGSGQSSVVN